jgi:NAD(P)-dependent dehydrogenase (short-subunit alcohol dehydrogenase family)
MAGYEQLLSLTGRRIILTGCASGIGKATAEFLGRQGAFIVICDIQDDIGEIVASRISSASPDSLVSYRHLDVTSKTECQAGVAAAVEFLGGLDSLIHAAGIIHQDIAESIGEEEVHQMIDTNVKGMIFMNQAVFHYLKENGGSILNFGSDIASEPLPGLAHYAASKGAVHSYTRAVAKEWGTYQIRVNAVLPAVWTEMYDRFRQKLDKKELEVHDRIMSERLCIGTKLGDPTKDLAPVLAFLMSDASSYITGQLICVNGGLSQVR